MHHRCICHQVPAHLCDKHGFPHAFAALAEVE